MMNDVPYHNFYHVADVAHSVYRMITLSESIICMSQLEKYALMLAAVCHDMDHPGERLQDVLQDIRGGAGLQTQAVIVDV